ncbi:MAG: GCN5-related N-acetyltransferase [candidate division TM6 bacterium GW2011_GWF2_33_332]|nr:MAG: GCN5-related N-acetyltransferase [candidate division TM6 bacterium GW2011_GWF2_33_332]
MKIYRYSLKKIPRSILAELIMMDDQFEYARWDIDTWHSLGMDFYLNQDKYDLFLIENWYGFVIGYAFFRKDPESYHLMKMAIVSKDQSKGLGTKLFEYVKNYYKGKHETYNITLEVKEDNVKGIGLYKKTGFEELQKLENYYAENIHGIKMILKV